MNNDFLNTIFRQISNCLHAIWIVYSIGVIFWLTSLAHESSAQSTVNDNQNSNFLQIYQNLQALPFDPQKISPVENLTMTKDRAKFVLKKGTLYFSEAIAGKVTGVVFLGEGVFELNPPTKIERYQLRRFVDKDSLRESFSAAYFRVADNTVDNLISRLEMRSGQIPKNVPELHEKISKFLLEDRRFNLTSRISEDLLNKTEQGLFLAVLEHPQPNYNFPYYYIFDFDSQANEEVAVYQYFPHRVNKPFYTLCSFHKISEYVNPDSMTVVQIVHDEVLHVDHYKMNLKLEKSGKIKAEVEMSYTPQIDSLRLLTFNILHELNIDSIKSTNGDTLSFIKEKEETAFSVQLSDYSAAQKKAKLIVYYSGKILEPTGAYSLLKDKFYWFPRFGYMTPATFDLTYEYPKNWQVISIGKQRSLNEIDNQAISQWVEDRPAITAAFAFGHFDSTTFLAENNMPVKIYSSPDRTKYMRKKIGGDVANSLYVFQNLFRSIPYLQLNVVESPSRLSFSFPGILFLSTLTFEREVKGIMEALRGHEVSHQWWGNLVGWKTYHDQWLSEGLAEYSGALITQFTLNGDKTFFEILEGWRNDLLEQGHIGVSTGLRRFGFSKRDLVKSRGLKAGPIWLGRRLGDEYPVDYYLMTYEKAAYVIHMLRTLLHDFDSGSDERFWNLLADYVETYKWQRATTEDFKQIIEKHVNQKMDWFFNQWIYGIEVPTYLYSYKEKNENEQYWLDLTVRQENVSPEFKMFIPIGIEFNNHEKKCQLIWMSGREKAFQLGPFKAQPVKLIFNDFAGVLARVKSK